MLCTRCGGLLILNLWNTNDGVQSVKLLSTRCVNCGCIDDAVIRGNRRRQQRTRMTPSRGSAHHAKLLLLSRIKPLTTRLLKPGTSIGS